MSLSLGYNIRKIRREKNMSQEELADKLGYKSYTTIQKWESGVSDPPFKVLKELSRIFNVDIDFFTKVTDEPISAQIAQYMSLVYKDPDLQELIHLYADLDTNDHKALLSYASFLLSK